jgi:hypothetical protein
VLGAGVEHDDRQAVLVQRQASQRSEASWSSPPVGAPTTSFSTARVAASSSSSSRSSSSTSTSAVVTAHTTAADDESPAPDGTSLSTWKRSGGTSAPRSASTSAHPST